MGKKILHVNHVLYDLPSNGNMRISMKPGWPGGHRKQIKHVKVCANNFGQCQNVWGKFWRILESLVDLVHEFVFFFGRSTLTTSHMVWRGGSRLFIWAVWPAAPTKPSLQIMYLQERFPDRPYKSICRGCCSTSRPYNICLQERFSLEPSLQYIFS